jgi:pimeloyl-ACP methyl ester carboxylesterase
MPWLKKHLSESFAAMLIKNILITEPANPVLRQLVMQFLGKADLRLVCFDEGEGGGEDRLIRIVFPAGQGESRFSDCKEVSVNEIWHTANSADSVEESTAKTERTLLLARRQKNPVLHYVSGFTAPHLKAGPFTGVPPRCSDERQKHLLNETAIERSGCKFRIYRLPWSPEGIFHSAASVWAQFTQHLGRFKTEIDDRLPGYFTAQPLRLCLREGGAIDIAGIHDIVQAMEQIYSSGLDGTYFHIRTQQPLSVQECLHALAASVGVHLQIVCNGRQQNYVDRLFALRTEKLLDHLERSANATIEGGPESSFAGQVWFSVPPVSLQNFAAACGSKSRSAPVETAEWKSGFKGKQVLLPEGVVLKYYVGGEGQKPLVLLNAYGQSFRYWERFIQAVSPCFRIILWVPRGNDGDTIGLKVASPQAVHADDLEKVLRQEEIEGCTLLAWCSGPKLALEYHKRYPGRASSMVFVAGSFKGLRQHKALETEYEKNLEPLLEAIEKYPESADVVLEYLKGILLAQGKQARSMDELRAMSDHGLQQALSAVNVSLQELALHPFYAANVVAYARQMRDFWNYDFVPALNKVEVPMLFVGGDCDRIASQAIAKAVAGMAPEAKYLEVKGGTHYIHYDQWDLLAEVVRQIANAGGKLEFNAPWASLAELNQEFMTTRQN